MESEHGHDVRRELARSVVESGWGLLELRPMRMSLEEIFLSLTTEEIADSAGRRDAPPEGTAPMGNVIAIAQKELKSYFSSPIAYIAIGFFALLYGYFYVAILSVFRPPEHADEPVPAAGRRR